VNSRDSPPVRVKGGSGIPRESEGAWGVSVDVRARNATDHGCEVSPAEPCERTRLNEADLNEKAGWAHRVVARLLTPHSAARGAI